MSDEECEFYTAYGGLAPDRRKMSGSMKRLGQNGAISSTSLENDQPRYPVAESPSERTNAYSSLSTHQQPPSIAPISTNRTAEPHTVSASVAESRATYPHRLLDQDYSQMPDDQPTMPAYSGANSMTPQVSVNQTAIVRSSSPRQDSPTEFDDRSPFTDAPPRRRPRQDMSLSLEEKPSSTPQEIPVVNDFIRPSAAYREKRHSVIIQTAAPEPIVERTGVAIAPQAPAVSPMSNPPSQSLLMTSALSQSGTAPTNDRLKTSRSSSRQAAVSEGEQSGLEESHARPQQSPYEGTHILTTSSHNPRTHSRSLSSTSQTSSRSSSHRPQREQMDSEPKPALRGSESLKRLSQTYVTESPTLEVPTVLHGQRSSRPLSSHQKSQSKSSRKGSEKSTSPASSDYGDESSPSRSPVQERSQTSSSHNAASVSSSASATAAQSLERESQRIETQQSTDNRPRVSSSEDRRPRTEVERSSSMDEQFDRPDSSETRNSKSARHSIRANENLGSRSSAVDEITGSRSKPHSSSQQGQPSATDDSPTRVPTSDDARRKFRSPAVEDISSSLKSCGSGQSPQVSVADDYPTRLVPAEEAQRNSRSPIVDERPVTSSSDQSRLHRSEDDTIPTVVRSSRHTSKSPGTIDNRTSSVAKTGSHDLHSYHPRVHQRREDVRPNSKKSVNGDSANDEDEDIMDVLIPTLGLLPANCSAMRESAHHLLQAEYIFLTRLKLLIVNFEEEVKTEPGHPVARMMQQMTDIFKTSLQLLYLPLVKQLYSSPSDRHIENELLKWFAQADKLFTQCVSEYADWVNAWFDAKLSSSWGRSIQDFETSSPGVQPWIVFSQLWIYNCLFHLIPQSTRLESMCTRMMDLYNTLKLIERDEIFERLKGFTSWDTRYRENWNLDEQDRKIYLAGELRVHDLQTTEVRQLILLDNYLLSLSDTGGEVIDYTVIDDLQVLSDKEEPIDIREDEDLPSPWLRSQYFQIADPLEIFKYSISEGNSRRLYPFIVATSGSEIELQAPTEVARLAWHAAILEAITARKIQLARDREPFDLLSLSETSFALPPIPTSTVYERPLAWKRVNCAASFTRAELGLIDDGKRYTILGYDDGLVMSDGNPKIWMPIALRLSVQQMHLFPEFGVLIFLAHESLYAFAVSRVFDENPFKNYQKLGQHVYETIYNEWIGACNAELRVLLTPMKLGISHVLSFSVGIHDYRVMIAVRSKSTGQISVNLLELICGKRTSFDESNMRDLADGERRRLLLEMREVCHGRGGLLVGRELLRSYRMTAMDGICLNVTILQNCIIIHSRTDEDRAIFKCFLLDSPAKINFPTGSMNLDISDKVESMCQNSATKAISLIKISDDEFLFCFSTFFVICSSDGKLIEYEPLIFPSIVEDAVVVQEKLIVFNRTTVDVWDISERSLVQRFVGQDVRLLTMRNIVQSMAVEDVVFAMENPNVPQRQMILGLQNRLH
ncbi:CNH domain-containing protein [Limtongia smithiae]|uniref:CNH domain-containing protein n=1 Tax=Limtongia smithiae TaxID=1125753 RepID=UPI0034CE78A9